MCFSNAILPECNGFGLAIDYSGKNARILARHAISLSLSYLHYCFRFKLLLEVYTEFGIGKSLL